MFNYVWSEVEYKYWSTLDLLSDGFFFVSFFPSLLCYLGVPAAWWIILMFMLFIFLFSSIKPIETSDKRNPSPPWGPETLRSSASGMRVWAWRWLCIPTPECHQWSSEHPEASRLSEVQLWGHIPHTVNEHFNATQMLEYYQYAACWAWCLFVESDEVKA